MKKSSLFRLSILFIAGFTLTNCNSDSNNKYKIYSAINESNNEYINLAFEIATARKDVNSDFEKFILQTEAKIIRNELNISKLKFQLIENKFITNEKYIVTIDSIGKTNKIIKVKLENFVATGSGNWKIFETELNHDLNELLIAYNDASGHIIK